MSKIKVSVLGNGVFGKFLVEQLAEVLDGKNFSHYKRSSVDEADILILAIPAEGYEEAARKYSGKHLVNVCSVQNKTSNILRNNAHDYTSFHPMFGPRSWVWGENDIIVTHVSNNTSVDFIQFFCHVFGCKAHYAIDGQIITPYLHDQYMAKTHKQVVLLSDLIEKVVDDAKDVPELFLTPSFKKLANFRSSILDMPEGTKSSILSNQF